MEPQVPLPTNAVPATDALRRALRVGLPLAVASAVTGIGLLVYFELVAVLLALL